MSLLPQNHHSPWFLFDLLLLMSILAAVVFLSFKLKIIESFGLIDKSIEKASKESHNTCFFFVEWCALNRSPHQVMDEVHPIYSTKRKYLLEINILKVRGAIC